MSSIVKICGITRPEDARTAVALGARAVGCTTDPENPRCVTPAQAKEIYSAAGRGITKILCFRGGDFLSIAEAARKAGTRHVQLREFDENTAEQLEAKNLVVYRVHDVPTGTNLLPPMHPEPNPKRPAMLRVAEGNHTLTFPWELLGNEAPAGTFIGGAVRPENICALLTHHPYGVDIVSGVERSPGVKDEDRLVLLFDTMENGI